ncbi:MAG: rod shape-determining protein MreD [Gammaproteobacteria bacterium]|nr:rod shape-determining protein MreD [Gammaproteobacteria bacterium]
MSEQRQRTASVVALSVVIALVLAIMPMPEWAGRFRPDWVALALVYWCMALPNRVGVGIGWGTGLLTDVATGALLGQHALAFTVLAYVTGRLHQRLRVYPLWQQAASILVLLMLNRLILVWINGIVGHPVESWTYWAPALTGALLWPWIFVVLRGLRRRFDVS